MGRYAVLLLALLLIPAVAMAQRPPVCDVTCGPDPASGGTYSGTIDARPAPYNARGGSLSTVPRTPTGPRGGGGGGAGTPTSPVVLNGSESYQYAIPIVHL